MRARSYHLVCLTPEARKVTQLMIEVDRSDGLKLGGELGEDHKGKLPKLAPDVTLPTRLFFPRVIFGMLLLELLSVRAIEEPSKLNHTVSSSTTNPNTRISTSVHVPDSKAAFVAKLQGPVYDAVDFVILPT